MASCTVCGNDYDSAFTVRTSDGMEHVFDSIECAAHVIAPVCAHCGCQILGHGVQAGGEVFCCASCATRAGVEGLRDRV